MLIILYKPSCIASAESCILDSFVAHHESHSMVFKSVVVNSL